MPLRIKTHLEWEQKTREGRYETHFIRTVSIDDLTGAHGLSPGLTFHLNFGTSYRTDPEIEIKVVEGLELLNSVSIHVKTTSGVYLPRVLNRPGVVVRSLIEVFQRP